MIEFDTATEARARRDMVCAVVKKMQTDTGGPLTPPPVVPAIAKPKVHHVVAWRNDGEVRKTPYDDKERAFEAARALHWAIVWKWAVMDGREMIARVLVNAPEG
jgi:hypothetical protein